jgi:hypothetical protein
MTRLEALAGTDNPYSLNEVVGKGVLLAKAGGAVYVTACSQVGNRLANQYFLHTAS